MTIVWKNGSATLLIFREKQDGTVDESFLHDYKTLLSFGSTQSSWQMAWEQAYRTMIQKVDPS